MKYLKALGYALLLLCGILLYWHLHYHHNSGNDAVVIQQIGEAKPIAAQETNSTKKTHLTPRDAYKKSGAESPSPRTISDIIRTEKFTTQNQVLKNNKNNKQANDALFADHDDIDFYDVQDGPDHAFTQPQKTTINSYAYAATTNKPLQMSDYHQYVDRYTGTNPQLDQQLLQNDTEIIAQQKLVDRLKAKDDQMLKQANNTPRTRFYTLDLDAMENNYDNLINAQKELESLYDQEDHIMSARKNAYEQKQAMLARQGSSLFTYPSMNIKTKVASPYNTIGDMARSSQLVKINNQKLPAAKPFETSSSDLIELD